MSIHTGVFGNGSNLEDRFKPCHDKLEEFIVHIRAIGIGKIVLTSGSYDLLHEGHLRYLEVARNFGDLLVVAVDSDEKIRKRKGENRPVENEKERVEKLVHVRHIDIVTLKNLGDPKWNVIKRVNPDILIATKETYSEGELVALQEFCGEVKVLEPTAATSTSAKIRLQQMNYNRRIIQAIQGLELPALIGNAISEQMEKQ